MARVAPIHEADFENRYPAGRSSRAWLVSLVLHLAFLIVLSLITTTVVRPVAQILISSEILEQPLEVPQIPPEKFQVRIDSPKVGASSLADAEAAKSLAPEIGELSEVPSPDVEPFDFSQFRHYQPSEPIQGYELSPDQIVKGSAGFAVTGAEGAVDRITQEILASLEERKTLVVWFFDQSASLIRQRETIRKRFDRIYEELGVIKDSGNSKFTTHGTSDALLTSVVAFGKDVSFPIKKPTADYEEIHKAVEGIERDNSGDEFVFMAIQKSIVRYKKYRRADASGKPDRNVMFVVFSDEAGDDQDLLDATTRQCTNLAIPVYVVGVPAPFGQQDTVVKWVDPDPQYDQTPGRGIVRQGPESLFPERVQIAFSKNQDAKVRLDSGFGPFALTRLARESGGHYFPVHANRETAGKIRWKDVPKYSSHLSAFFDPRVMRHYRPDYVSA
ncbi:VWA domain-containing protein, partial [Planctomycetota bacterium]